MAFTQNFFAQQAVHSMINTIADPGLKQQLLDAVLQAIKTVPWLKVFQAVAHAAAGGFTSASIAEAVAMLLGTAFFSAPPIAEMP